MKIELDRHLYEVDVAVSEQLQEDVMLGMDLPLMKHLIYAMNSEEKQTAREQLGPSETSYAVTTRAQARQQKTQKEKHNPPMGSKHKEYQTRAQKRAQRKQYQTQTLSRNELIELQNKDPEIQQWEQNEQYQFKTQIYGVLCRRWSPRDKQLRLLTR